jgi:phosphatidylglycerophosphate synthase
LPLLSPPVDSADVQLFLLADAPQALVEFCGITLLERLLRIVQRLGFTRVLIISTTPEAIRGEIARPSWARAKVWADIAVRGPGRITVQEIRKHLSSDQNRALIIPADVYCDDRLLRALRDYQSDAALIDSHVPADLGIAHNLSGPGLTNTFCGPVIVSTSFFSGLEPSASFADEVEAAIQSGRLATIDAATQPTYITSMRRHLRPLCFPARLEDRRQVEKVILDAAQNGTLDLPAYLHAPIETRIIRYLCQTPVSPNQISLFGFFFGLAVTFLFFTGHLVSGIVLALIFGIIDGLDGKQARVKVETTARGQWEHRLDFIVEYSWWIALACYFQSSQRWPQAFLYLALLIGSDLIDREAKRRSKLITGRLLDDVSGFDRLFRLVSGRRNVYVWILAVGLAVGRMPDAYRVIVIWAAASTAIHVVRAVTIWRGRRTAA